MGEKSNLSIQIKALLNYNETETISINEQLRQLEEKLKHISRKVEISEKTIKTINDSYNISLAKSKGVHVSRGE